MRALAVAGLLGGLVTSTATPSAAASLTAYVGGVRVEVSSVPQPPARSRMTAYTVRLVDSAGTPVTGAQVTLTGRMTDGMSVAAPLRPTGEPGIYRGEVLFTMAGRWDLRVRVARQGRRFEVPLKEEVAR